MFVWQSSSEASPSAAKLAIEIDKAVKSLCAAELAKRKRSSSSSAVNGSSVSSGNTGGQPPLKRSNVFPVPPQLKRSNAFVIENGDDDVKSKASPDIGNQVDSSGPRPSSQTPPVIVDVEEVGETQLDGQNESVDEESFYQLNIIQY